MTVGPERDAHLELETIEGAGAPCDARILARLAVLMAVFAGDPEAWLSCIRDSEPTPESAEDVRFLKSVRRLSTRDPRFSAQLREIATSLASVCAELEEPS